MFKRLLLLVGVLLLASSCNMPFLNSQADPLKKVDERSLTGNQGIVLLHAINKGGLMATRWVNVNNPNIKESFTIFHSKRHNLTDKLDDYDLVTVPAGTYALYSIYSNCQEGYRPKSTEWDEVIKKEVATNLGMVSWLRRWPASSSDSNVGFGLGIGSGGGWSGSGVGVGVGVGVGGAVDQGLPVATCNLINEGVSGGRILLAEITVNPGEIVYAGEMDFEFGPDANCDEKSNFMTTGESSIYCGASYLRMRVGDSFQRLAYPFLVKTLGHSMANQAIVRLVKPGALAENR